MKLHTIYWCMYTPIYLHPDDVTTWEWFPHYWVSVRGIYPEFPSQNTKKAELWCFLCCCFTVELLVIWDAMMFMGSHCNGSRFRANYHTQTYPSQTGTIICSMLMSIHAINFLNALMWPPHLRPTGLINNSHSLKIDMKFFIIHWCRCKTLYVYALYITVMSHNCLGISDHW